jgi:hypothetical protein
MASKVTGSRLSAWRLLNLAEPQRTVKIFVRSLLFLVSFQLLVCLFANLGSDTSMLASNQLKIPSPNVRNSGVCSIGRDRRLEADTGIQIHNLPRILVDRTPLVR